MVSRWCAQVDERVNRLFDRDEKIFEKLESLDESCDKMAKWVAHQQGIEEGLRRAREHKEG